MALHRHSDGVIGPQVSYKHLVCAFSMVTLAPSLPMYVLLYLGLICYVLSWAFQRRGHRKGEEERPMLAIETMMVDQNTSLKLF
jgi:hypothetical protein